jgi:subtilisin-like proprotein convertase family protein
MPSPRRTQLALVALALLCGLLTWRARQRLAHSPEIALESERAAEVSKSVPPSSTPATTPRVSPAAAAAKWVKISTLNPGQPARFADAKFTNRFRNTDASMKALERNDRAVQFRNALIDTASSEPLALPAALQSDGNPGAYVVQANGLTTDAFRRELHEAGFEIVSYIPHNAYLVRGSRAAAERVASASTVAAILPYEPAFKLEPELLNELLANALPLGEQKFILTVPDPAATWPELKALGAKEELSERGPFGTLITVTAPTEALAALARLAGVQMVERWTPRAFANDLTGPKLGSTTNALNTSNYFGLTGEGVLINLNDSGVDASHPDLKDRVFTLDALKDTVLLDLDGHGTHVAGTIAGDGSASASLGSTPSGSVTNASVQGKAPKARLFVLPVDLIQGPPSGDTFLQEEAAKAPGRPSRNRPLISNNSWGYLSREYSSHSASYDAAVRDALPRESGSQPILYVFSAGNEGVGGDSGVGGIPDSIASPGNAKNVITVGALESPRNLTNAIVYDTNGIAVKIGSREFPNRGYSATNQNYFTNEVLREFTDTDYQVAGFSSRGNVGVEIEGESGRFKPDVVAPGSFILSARSAAWRIENQFLPDSDSFYLFEELERSNEPNYRYESGTSMSAPAISGLLAQMQEYFEQKQDLFPAASTYKAMLINSSLATSETYAPDPKEVFNYGGWGQPSLPRSVRSGFKSPSGDQELAYIEASNGVGTGEVGRFRVSLKSTNVPLRLTLVWTDPPGNPAAAAKLVNDLDLVVSNTASGKVYFGNDFTPGSGFSRFQTTNEPVGADRINNVERVVLQNPLDEEYVVLIVGHRVNVNARWDHPEQVAQDFSLAISSDVAEGEVAGEVKDFELLDFVSLGLPSPTTPAVITNGVALFNLRVGAHSPLIGGANGTTNQWRFFTFTNIMGAITNGAGTDSEIIRKFGSNVAFVIFPSDPQANLSRVRTNGPDLDLYVSRDSGLLTLESASISNAWQATSQGGTELIALTNQPQGDEVVFYVGVKSEDQQSGEFSFFGISTDQPFTTIDEEGMPHAFATPIQPLQDGTPDRPGIGQWIAISLISEELRRVTPTVTTTHENFPDLVGQLRLGSTFAVLNNHGPLLDQTSGVNISVLYDDSGSGDSLSATNSRPSDGPGTLGEFMGQTGGGPWFFTTVDNALGNTGSITGFDLRLMPNDFGPQFVERCVRARLVELEVFNVPVDANRLTITITNRQNEQLTGPLEVYVRRDAIPDLVNPTNNDKYATVFPPTGGDLTISLRDVPPLTPGRYFVAVYNPNSFEICYRIRARLERGLDGSLTKVFNSGEVGDPLTDEALTESSVTVNDSRSVTAIGAGLRINHPRISDLEVRLVNPQGDRTVLVENRGRTSANAFGQELIITNGDFSHVAFTFERASGRSLLYVNGRQVAEQTFDGLLPVTTNAVLFATDGFQRNAGPVALDDFGLWKRALTPDNVRDLYRYGAEDHRGKVVDDREAGLLALWPFDGTGAELLFDFAVDYPASTAVVGQIGQALQFGPGQIGFIEPLPELNVVRNSGFTLEGWVKADTNLPTIIAGWARTNDVSAPLLVANFPPPIGNGPGSFSVVYTNLSVLQTNGSALRFATAGGLVTPGTTVTNTLYAVFTELTNVTSELIKFAVPPYVTDTRTRVLGRSTFDLARPTGDDIFEFGEIVDGWTVVSNQVQWRVDGEWALTGSGFMETFPNLGNGTGSQIQRTIPTIPGRFYSVSTGYRRVPGSFGPSSQVDVFADGVEIAGFIGGERWQTNLTFVQAVGSTLKFEIANAAKGNVVARPATAVAVIDAVGQVTGIQVIDPGAGYSEPPAVSLVGAGSGATAVATLEFDYVARIEITNPGTNYVPGTQVVVAAPPVRPVFAGNLLDEILIVEEPKGLYVPEEPLRPLAKGSAVGEWRLEVTDSRGGEVGELLSWQMQLTFAPTNPPAYRLTGGVPFATNVVGDAITYFIVEAPPEATYTTNTLVSLSGGPLNLLFSRFGLPDGLQTEDYYLLSGVQDVPQSALLYTNVLPPFRPGQRYYLGVQNLIASQSNAFSIRVDFGLPIQPLTNNVPVAANNANLGLIDYYSFNVSPAALGVRFSVSNLGGDVNLIVSKAPGLPTRTVHDYASTNTGTVPESIEIDPFSQPVPLEPGLWYLGVYPADALNRTNPIAYTINASELSGTAGPITNGVPINGTILNDGQIAYYYLDITNEAATATFVVTNLTGNVDLFVRQGLPLPAANSFEFSSTNAGLADEGLFLQATVVPQLQTPGRWFLAVIATDPAPVSFTVAASYTVPNSDIELLVDSIPQSSLVEAGPTNRLYRFDVPFDSTSRLLFEIYGLDGEADLLVARDNPPGSNPNSLSALKPGLLNELIVVTESQFSQLGGQWYVDVRFPATNQVNFTVRAATRQDGLLQSGTPLVGIYSLPTEVGQTPILRWNAIPGETYQVQYTESLDDSPLVWLPATPPVTAAGEVGTVSVPAVDPNVFPTIFYRIIQLASP